MRPNIQRVLYTEHPTITINSSRERVVTFGFISLNGESVFDLRERARSSDCLEFLEEVKRRNGEQEVIIIADNAKIHHAKMVVEGCEKLDITLVYLPPYSPDLNPIEFVWRDGKKSISNQLFKEIGELKEAFGEALNNMDKPLTYARSWVEKFLNHLIICPKG